MTLNQTTEFLTKYGIDRITLGLSEKGKPIVMCEQLVATGHGAMKTLHQCVGDHHEEAFDNLKKEVEHCSQLQTKILKIKDN